MMSASQFPNSGIFQFYSSQIYSNKEHHKVSLSYVGHTALHAIFIHDGMFVPMSMPYAKLTSLHKALKNEGFHEESVSMPYVGLTSLHHTIIPVFNTDGRMCVNALCRAHVSAL